MGPAGFLNKVLAGTGSLLTGLIRSVTEGYGLEVQRERGLQIAKILTNTLRIKYSY